MNKKNREVMIKSVVRRFPMNLAKTSVSLFSMMKSGEKSVMPYKLQIESASICNLKCRMCPQNNMKRVKCFLKFHIFKKIYDEIRPPYVNLTGIGEPLMNPDIFKIIKYAKSKGSYVKLDTNGMLLTEENINRLLDSGIDIVSNSIDGIDKKTYEKIRIGSDFDRVIKNLKNLVKIRNLRKATTEIHIFFVLQKDNFMQFPEFIKFVDSIGVDSISGTFIQEESYQNNRKFNIENCSKKELDELIKKLKNMKTRANLEIEGVFEIINKWEDNKKKNYSKVPCYKPWYSPFVTADGTVTPCCYCVDKEIILGEASKESFKKIWNNEKMKKFRKMVASNRTGLCTRCGSDESYIKEQFNRIPLSGLISKRS